MPKPARGVIGGSGRIGVYRLDQYTELNRAGDFFWPAGQAEFLTPGTYSWVCPPGITKVSAVCVGAGGGGYSSWSSAAGGGGGLGWKNDIPVVAGQTYTVVVGAGGGRNGAATGFAGGNSYFISLATVAGYGGGNVSAGVYTNGPNQSGSGGGWVGDGGGAGGSASYVGGGGAGGYTGNGGVSNANAPAGGGGAGGGYHSSAWGTAGGGGVGIYGIRTDYTAQTNRTYNNSSTTLGAPEANIRTPAANGLGGEGGSRRTGVISGQFTGYGGQQGENAVGWSSGVQIQASIQGGFPGGGGGGPGTSSGGGRGGDGAVRIMWVGEKRDDVARSYPSVNTEDVT